MAGIHTSAASSATTDGKPPEQPNFNPQSSRAEFQIKRRERRFSRVISPRNRAMNRRIRETRMTPRLPRSVIILSVFPRRKHYRGYRGYLGQQNRCKIGEKLRSNEKITPVDELSAPKGTLSCRWKFENKQKEKEDEKDRGDESICSEKENDLKKVLDR